ncbi:hypothetical protein BT63DRAFT_483601 [Microthyrium microscopicum]|uniref:C2H2-type domain-containing protein n=1 Tax=Microthyrium microscopicum TaxID=703497 RepID=A0A6A6TYU0_9PEZI|nr:hypothetical protein BT63DRAFT_483601 [Microthyrium microscopicum]
MTPTRTHAEGMPHRKLACQVCGTVYAKKEHLERHTRIHTGDKPFSCSICGRAFSRQDSLARHKGLHQRQRPGRAPSKSSQERTTRERDLPQPSVAQNPLNKQIRSTPSATTDFNSISSEGGNIGLNRTPIPDPQLMWPDLEHLYQSVISYDTPTQPQPELDPLQFPTTEPGHFGVALHGFHSSAGILDQNGGLITQQRPQAVHYVSRMVSAASEQVNEEINASSITSRFFDECLHMYFTRFNRTFPILHQPTFVLNDCTHPLLLNAIALGSLYLGTPDAVAKGEALWRLAHTAVATSWQSLIQHRGQYDSCSGIQLVLTALLGQTYAYLSRNRALRTTGHVFHSLGFFWARHTGMLDVPPIILQEVPSKDAPRAEKTHRWQIWAANEIQRRAILGHYILDGQIATLACNPTTERHASNKLTFPIDEDAFAAETVEEWLSKMKVDELGRDNSFSALFVRLFSPNADYTAITQQATPISLRVILEGIQSIAQESRGSPTSILGVPSAEDIKFALSKTFDIITTSPQVPEIDRLEAIVRWHGICLDFEVDAAAMCRALCAQYGVPQNIFHGGVPLRYFQTDLRTWARTKSARKALLHAITMVEIIEQLPQGRSNDIHLPASLFAAATVYTAFSLGGESTVVLPTIIPWRDVDSVGNGTESMEQPLHDSIHTLDKYLNQLPLTNSILTRRKNLLYELGFVPKMLRCIAEQWGIAYEMAAIVDRWVATFR